MTTNTRVDVLRVANATAGDNHLGGEDLDKRAKSAVTKRKRRRNDTHMGDEDFDRRTVDGQADTEALRDEGFLKRRTIKYRAEECEFNKNKPL